MITTHRMLVVALALVTVACNPPKQQSRGERRAQGSIKGDAEAAGTKDGGGSGGGAALPPYLFSLADAEAIKVLVEPHRKPIGYDEDTGDTSTKYGELRDFMETLLNKALKVEALKPGRKLKVHILDDETINAAADGDQNVFIHTGYIENIGARAFMGTLCHEIAHSTLNHVARQAEYQTESNAGKALAAFQESAITYLEGTYDQTGEKYTHDEAGYKKMLAEWKKVEPSFSNLRKRLEAEADVVGAMICAKIGVKSTDFIDGYVEESEVIERIYGAAAASSGDSASTFKDGESVEFPPQTMYQYLFPLDSHPTDTERIEGLKRVKTAIDARLDESQTFFEQWKAGVTERDGMALTAPSIDFLRLSRAHVETRTTSTGRVIAVKKPRH